jgi:hypothetical protein
MSFLVFSSFLLKLAFQRSKSPLKKRCLFLLLAFQLEKPAEKPKQTDPYSVLSFERFVGSFTETHYRCQWQQPDQHWIRPG